MSMMERNSGVCGEAAQLRFVWFEITNRCNLACRHCYAESGPKEPATGSMTLENWQTAMDDARGLGCSAIQFIGGEPTLHPAFKHLITAAREKGFESIEVYTNATRLSPELCRFLQSAGVQVAVSFYSSSKTVHDAITMRRGSYERTIGGLKEALRSQLPIRVGLVTVDDDPATVPNAKAFLENLGIRSVRVDRERHIGRSKSSIGSIDPIEQLCGACGNKRLAINARGEVSPCVFSHFEPLGQVFEGLATMLDRAKHREFGKRLVGSCSPSCGPNECSPGDDSSPSCFPNGCDPDMCNPISCSPRD